MVFNLFTIKVSIGRKKKGNQCKCFHREHAPNRNRLSLMYTDWHRGLKLTLAMLLSGNPSHTSPHLLLAACVHFHVAYSALSYLPFCTSHFPLNVVWLPRLVPSAHSSPPVVFPLWGTNDRIGWNVSSWNLSWGRAEWFRGSSSSVVVFMLGRTFLSGCCIGCWDRETRTAGNFWPTLSLDFI